MRCHYSPTPYPFMAPAHILYTHLQGAARPCLALPVLTTPPQSATFTCLCLPYTELHSFARPLHATVPFLHATALSIACWCPQSSEGSAWTHHPCWRSFSIQTTSTSLSGLPIEFLFLYSTYHQLPWDNKWIHSLCVGTGPAPGGRNPVWDDYPYVQADIRPRSWHRAGLND